MIILKEKSPTEEAMSIHIKKKNYHTEGMLAHIKNVHIGGEVRFFVF